MRGTPSKGASRHLVGLIPFLGALLVVCPLLQVNAAPPSLSRLRPAAVVPGMETPVQLDGDNLGGPARLWTSFPCGGLLERERADVPFTIKLPPRFKPGIGAVRLVTTNGMSGLTMLLIDSTPGIVAVATNNSLSSAQSVPKRTAVDGVCEELRSSFFRIAAKKGDRLAFEVVAQRLGSPLDPLLRVLDVTGRELAAVDDSPGLGADARIDFRAPKSGDYFVEVRDTRYAGGPRHRYRLRLADPLPVPLPFLGGPELSRFTAPTSPLPAAVEQEPNDSAPQSIAIPVELAGRFAVPGDQDAFAFQARRGERLIFSGRTRSLGSPCELVLRIQTTNGTMIAESNPTGADEGVLTNRFAEAGTYHLLIEELNRQGSPESNYRLAIQSLEPGFQISVENAQFSAPAGDSIEFEVQSQRRDYDGPILLELQGLGAGFRATNLVIAAKTNATKIRVTIPDDRKLGEFYPLSLVGTAQVGGSDVAVRVSTLPALRSAFPALPFPPPELNGLLSLSISTSKADEPNPPRRRRN